MPNPLNDPTNESLDSYSVKYVIGDGNCSDPDKVCNDRLIPEKYGLIARVFTRDGYRDTEPIFFEIGMSFTEIVSPEQIVYGSVGLMGLLSLVLLISCCMTHKKKQNILKKKKEAAEADENLLSFTSYCVLDKNPKPKPL